MRDLFVDVNLESEHDPARLALEMTRETAERLCAENGARLRTDRDPEIVIRRAVKPVTGRDVVLVATRWPVLAPETLEIPK